MDEAVLLSPERLSEYAVDGVEPAAVAMPRSVEEVSRLMRSASEQGLRVVPWGGGSQMALGNPPLAVDMAMALTRLDGPITHEAADLTVTAPAGVTLASFQAQLAKEGQYLPVQAPLPHRSTIGGCLATAASGPWRLAFGGFRDWLIGSSVVLADGTLAKSGGRVVKNVTGYDLNKLYAGSLGTLAVIVEATFKVAPLPAEARTLTAAFASIDAAWEASQALLRLPYLPRALHLVVGASDYWMPQLAADCPGEAHLLVEYAGGAGAVASKLDTARSLLAETGALSMYDRTGQDHNGQDHAGQDLWQSITDLGWDQEPAGSLLLRGVAPPSRIADLVRQALQGPHPPRCVAADPGYGLARLYWPEDGGPLTTEEMADVVARLRAHAVSLGGHLVIESCPLPLKRQTDVWGEAAGRDLMHRLKQRLDPGGILNPGRFVAGI